MGYTQEMTGLMLWSQETGVLSYLTGHEMPIWPSTCIWCLGMFLPTCIFHDTHDYYNHHRYDMICKPVYLYNHKRIYRIYIDIHSRSMSQLDLTWSSLTDASFCPAVGPGSFSSCCVADILGFHDTSKDRMRQVKSQPLPTQKQFLLR